MHEADAELADFVITHSPLQQKNWQSTTRWPDYLNEQARGLGIETRLSCRIKVNQGNFA